MNFTLTTERWLQYFARTLLWIAEPLRYLRKPVSAGIMEMSVKVTNPCLEDSDCVEL